ncbi:MAG: hypothetical protein ABMA13_23545 [Chthoniobacteraceae bacterium]
MPETEITRTPETATLVAQIYDLTAQIDDAKLKLDDAKAALILHAAPPALADKIRAEVELTPEERVALATAVAGKYADAGDRIATVVVPTQSSEDFELYRAEAYKAWLLARGLKKGSAKLARLFNAEREQQARELAGEHFLTLFDRFEVFEPCRGFAEVATRVFGKAQAKLAALFVFCRVEKPPASPHVKLDKPKAE